MVTAGVTVLAVTVTYCLWSDAQRNLVDEVVLGTLREIGRSTVAYSDRLIPTRISSWLAISLSQDRVSRAVSTVSYDLNYTRDIQYWR